MMRCVLYTRYVRLIVTDVRKRETLASSMQYVIPKNRSFIMRNHHANLPLEMYSFTL